ncbi:hypothetical protein MNBD_CHLOROFLEXI01-1835 [hydrothermal vent metagenome]|uniref:Uncharacterized protein n=1 Tax=hydrothermal vent metagenome TaxID=652676 RepID=A0A3B0VHE9_9ZZZZ
MLSMNISDQISVHWAAHREEIGLVWYLLPNQGQPLTNETAANLQQQITSYLLMTPFAPEAALQGVWLTEVNSISGKERLRQ